MSADIRRRYEETAAFADARDAITEEMYAQYLCGMRQGFCGLLEFFDARPGQTFTAGQVSLIIRGARDRTFAFRLIDPPAMPDFSSLKPSIPCDPGSRP